MDNININTEQEFDKLSEVEKSNYVKEYYNQKDGFNIYATSPDFNLRELEIDFILKHLKGKNILDLGCGNGYTSMRITEKYNINVIGIDFSESMISGAKRLLEQYPGSLKSKPVFYHADATNFIPETENNTVDTIISERFLLNLPSEQIQFKTIRHIHKLLIPQGRYLMIEGSIDGLRKLNVLRESIGLTHITDRGTNNLSSRKFDDRKIEDFLKGLFEIISVKTFDLYYIISRIIYPDFVKPENPDYSHFINKTAKKLEQILEIPSQGIGHIKCYVLEKKTGSLKSE